MKSLLTIGAGLMLAAVVGCESDNSTIAHDRDVNRNPITGDVTVKDTTYRQNDDGGISETRTKTKIDAD